VTGHPPALPALPIALADLAADNRYADVRLAGTTPVAFATAWENLLGDQVRREADRIGTRELRVVASLVQFGVAEKLLAVRLGLWARHDLVLAPDAIGICADTERWRFGLMPGASTAPASGGDGDGDVVAASVLADLEVLHAAIRRHCRVADGVLWGNTAAGVVSQAGRHHGRAGRRMAHLRDRLLARAPLRGRATDEPPHRRTTCCLYYRSAAGGTCGDCPIADTAVVRAYAGSAR
jgi:hypothetical protein